MQFNGSDTYVDVGSGSSLDTLGVSSMCAWIYPRSWGENNKGRIYDKNSNYIFFLENDLVESPTVSQTVGFFVPYSSANMRVLGDTNSITLNKWHHVCVTWDGNQNGLGANFYVNNVHANTTVNSAGSGDRSSDTGTSGFIGNSTVDRAFDGLIDDVRIYNRVLSADEIKRLYNMGGTAKIGRVSNSNSLSQGLVGWWTFDGNDISGIQAYDRSGSGNRGTLTNGPALAKGRLGQGLSFDGGNDLVNAGTNSSLNIGTSDYAVSVWIKARKDQGHPTQDSVLISSGACCVSESGIWFGINETTGVLELWVSNGTSYVVNGFKGTRDMRDDTWHHIVWVSRRSVGNQYFIDGTLHASDSSTNSDNIGAGTAFIIGAEDGSSNGFNGLVDDVRIYNRVLSPDEIRRLYTMGGTVKLGTSRADNSLGRGLVGWWTFDGNDISGVQAYDRSGSGNRGILTNGPIPAKGRLRQGLSFDGTTKYVDINNSSSLDFQTSPFTLSTARHEKLSKIG